MASSSRRAPRTRWAKSNSSSPTPTTSTCTTRPAANCSTRTSAPSAMAACASRTRGNSPPCSSAGMPREVDQNIATPKSETVRLQGEDSRAPHLFHRLAGRNGQDPATSRTSTAATRPWKTPARRSPSRSAEVRSDSGTADACMPGLQASVDCPQFKRLLSMSVYHSQMPPHGGLILVRNAVSV